MAQVLHSRRINQRAYTHTSTNLFSKVDAFKVKMKRWEFAVLCVFEYAFKMIKCNLDGWLQSKINSYQIVYLCARTRANALFWLSSCSSVATAIVCWGIHVTWNIKNSDISLNFHFARRFFFSRKTGANTQTNTHTFTLNSRSFVYVAVGNLLCSSL